MRNLVQIRPLVTKHPSKGFNNLRSYLEFHVFLNYFAIFDINYPMITCLMPFFPENQPFFTFSQIWLLS